jgi:hypothetical protein
MDTLFSTSVANGSGAFRPQETAVRAAAKAAADDVGNDEGGNKCADVIDDNDNNNNNDDEKLTGTQQPAGSGFRKVRTRPLNTSTNQY